MQAQMIHMTNSVEYRKICGLHLDRMNSDFFISTDCMTSFVIAVVVATLLSSSRLDQNRFQIAAV